MMLNIVAREIPNCNRKEMQNTKETNFKSLLFYSFTNETIIFVHNCFFSLSMSFKLSSKFTYKYENIDEITSVAFQVSLEKLFKTNNDKKFI